MVNFGLNTRCTMRAQSVHKLCIRFAVNQYEQGVNGSHGLTDNLKPFINFGAVA